MEVELPGMAVASGSWWGQEPAMGLPGAAWLGPIRPARVRRRPLPAGWLQSFHLPAEGAAWSLPLCMVSLVRVQERHWEGLSKKWSPSRGYGGAKLISCPGRHFVLIG
uniref:Uncharacterized protein n=1 Tax=Sphaerodactylus townsendi TaxID=933632 RepID=A0ACB8GDM8_9SAUR